VADDGAGNVVLHTCVLEAQALLIAKITPDRVKCDKAKAVLFGRAVNL
jgi:hypothetical protein